MSCLIEEVKSKAITHGSLPFWSWNDRLEPEELRRQIRNMHDMEMRGFFMHARGGLQTEYMSEEWYDCVKACIDEAKKLGMEAWAYDENGWPSGFAGGKLLENPDYHAVYLKATRGAFPTGEETPFGVYALDGQGRPTRVTAPVEGCSDYLTVYRRKEPTYVDTMRSDITDRFIEVTHVDYQKRLGEDFGNAMPGFFTDEPQYFRWATPCSMHMEQWYLEEYGYSVLDALPSLFIDYEGAERYRYDYWKMAFTKFTNGFSKRLYEWADANGIQITGHFIEEKTLTGQMQNCGAIMPQYQYEHIPGMDYLGRDQQKDMGPKQLGSVCAQTGRKKVLSEMFACCGWDVSPKELKHIAELQYVGGVNVMCHHLYPYSIRGQRKRDYPAFYSEHSLWQKDQKEFNHFFNNLGYMLSMGEEYAPVLVIHPIHSAWLKFRREGLGGEKIDTIRELEENTARLSDLLSGNQIPYHYGDETMMATMSEVKGRTVTVGKCTYDRVIVPACDTLDATTAKLLREFAANGGKIYTFMHHLPTRMGSEPAVFDFLNGCEDLTDEGVFEQLSASFDVTVEHTDNVTEKDLRMQVRMTEYGRLVYLTNLSDKEFRSLKVTLKNSRGFGALNISTLEKRALAGRVTEEGAEAYVTLLGSESLILVEDDAPTFLPFEMEREPDCIVLSHDFDLVEKPLNLLTLDRASVSLNGGAFSEVRPMERIRDELLRERFDGQLTLRFSFVCETLPETLEAITEPCFGDRFAVNGVELTVGENFAIDRSFRVTDIVPYVRLGENSIEVTYKYWQSDYVYYVLFGGVTETLRNCLVFDTEVENMFLRGSFAVKTNVEGFCDEPRQACRFTVGDRFVLTGQKDSIDVTDVVRDGYPFYCGELKISTTVNYKEGDPTLLRLNGRYATARVEVNGTEAGLLMFSEYLDLKGKLCEGENLLTVTLCNSYRNLLGPHHHTTAEPYSVNPKMLSTEKMWKNGECDQYDPRYAFVRFGLDV